MMQDIDTAGLMQDMKKLTFGEQIKKARLMRGMNLNQASKEIGCAYTSLQNWEDDLTMPRGKYLEKLTEYYELDKPMGEEDNVSNVEDNNEISMVAISSEELMRRVFDEEISSSDIRTMLLNQTKLISRLQDRLDSVYNMMMNNVTTIHAYLERIAHTSSQAVEPIKKETIELIVRAYELGKKE